MYDDVHTAMADATFEDLKQVTESLQYVVQSNREAMANDGEHLTRNSCSEECLMDQSGGALRLVSTLRDTYNTNSCDVCEEFRKDSKPLKAYEHRKGFESEKMSLMIEQVYQNEWRDETRTRSVLRRTQKGLKLLIVDEVSMISSITLLYMHLRLTEIMANNDYFGGISLVFFADFLQLPPVKGNQPFIPVSFFEAKQLLGAIASVDLWSIFQ